MTSNLLSGFYLSPVQAITTSDWGAILAISKGMAKTNLNFKHHESSFSFLLQDKSIPYHSFLSIGALRIFNSTTILLSTSY